MKRCPKCNRTYPNDAQKFCTIDGTALVAAQSPSGNLGETIRIDSAGLTVPPVDADDEVTKVISGKLPTGATGGFDPYRTVVSGPTPAQSSAPRDTQNLTPTGQS